MNKIVFLRYLPLTKKVVEDFYMEELSKEGYVIEYWDITRLFWKDMNSVESFESANELGILIKYFQSRRSLRKSIRENKKALFVSIMTFEWRVLFLFWYLTIYNCKKTVFSYWPLPLDYGFETNIVRKSLLHKIKNRIKKLFKKPLLFIQVVENVIKMKIIRFSIDFGIIRLYDYCFVGGVQGWKGIGQVSLSDLSRTKMYAVNNWDYDKFLRSDIRRGTKPYIVFLDEYYPFHPDARICDLNNVVDPNRYFDGLDKVFCELESIYKMPVVIAAHPKALKYKERNFFSGRKVVFNSTMELVAKSSLVLAHDSLSIGFAIMYMKPIVFISSNEIKEKLPSNHNLITSLSKYFRSPLIIADCISTDDLPQNFELPSHIKDIYKGMRNDYMSCVDPPMSNTELLKKYLKEIFDDINKDT